MLLTLPAALILAGAVAGTVAASAPAAPARPLPAAAQGHAYRHGLVPKRGQSVQTSSPATSPASAPAPSSNLAFRGGIDGVGVVTGKPKVYLVFWGSQWGTQGTDSNNDVTLSGDPQAEAPYLQQFLKGLGTGGETWSGVMTQYCQGITTGAKTCPSSNSQHVGYPTGGALGGTWVDESSAAPALASGNQLAQEAISAAIHFGDFSSNSQYVIVSPTGTNPDDWEGILPGDQAYCAWHDYTGDPTLDGGGAVSSPPGEPPVAFTNLPYQTDAGAGCGEDFVNSGSAGTLDGVSIVEGHEYAETITDTFPVGGWTDSGGNETGDKCAWKSSGQGAAQDITLGGDSFAVQSTWANDYNNGSGGCEISHPIVTDPGVTVSNPGTQQSTVNTPISPLQLTATDSNSAATLTWSQTGLPAGLSINSSTGEITGTPTSAGSNNVTITATDSTSTQGSTSFTWTVAKRSTSTSLSCTPTSVTVGVGTSCTVTVSDTDAGTASPPSGSVSISPSGSCTLATVASGQARCSTTYTPSAAGSQSLTAVYQGDSAHSGSTSNAVALSVGGSSGAPPANSSPPASSQPPAGSQPPATVSGQPPATVSNAPSSLCPAPTGKLSGMTLGLARLGMTRARVRAAYAHSSLRSSANEDIFCLTPTGINVGYPSAALLGRMTSQQRTSLRGRAIWITTANKHYSVDGIAVGAKLAAVERAIKHGSLISTGRVRWYLSSDGSATLAIEIRNGVVRELGIAIPQLTGFVSTRTLLIKALA